MVLPCQDPNKAKTCFGISVAVMACFLIVLGLSGWLLTFEANLNQPDLDAYDKLHALLEGNPEPATEYKALADYGGMDKYMEGRPEGIPDPKNMLHNVGYVGVGVSSLGTVISLIPLIWSSVTWYKSTRPGDDLAVADSLLKYGLVGDNSILDPLMQEESSDPDTDVSDNQSQTTSATDPDDGSGESLLQSAEPLKLDSAPTNAKPRYTPIGPRDMKDPSAPPRDTSSETMYPDLVDSHSEEKQSVIHADTNDLVEYFNQEPSQDSFPSAGSADPRIQKFYKEQKVAMDPNVTTNDYITAMCGAAQLEFKAWNQPGNGGMEQKRGNEAGSQPKPEYKMNEESRVEGELSISERLMKMQNQGGPMTPIQHLSKVEALKKLAGESVIQDIINQENNESACENFISDLFDINVNGKKQALENSEWKEALRSITDDIEKNRLMRDQADQIEEAKFQKMRKVLKYSDRHTNIHTHDKSWKAQQATNDLRAPSKDRVFKFTQGQVNSSRPAFYNIPSRTQQFKMRLEK